MGTLRDALLPVADLGGKLAQQFGLSRFTVTIRRRSWSGGQVGEGTATDSDIALTPPPRVRDITSRDATLTEAEYRALNSDVLVGQLYRIDQITPRYTNPDGSIGGYTPEQLRLSPNQSAYDGLVVLVGDDGYMRECEQVLFSQNAPFAYSMIVKEYDRPRAPLVSLAITPSPAAVQVGQSLQFVATGTYGGGSTSRLTSQAAWASANASIATVDPIGLVRGVAPGTVSITATLLDVQASVSVTVS